MRHTPVSVVAGEDGPFHRRGAAPAGKQREVQVHHRHPLEDLGADELAEGHDDSELDVGVEHVGDAVGHRDPELERALLDRRRRQRAPAAAAAVGCRHDERHVVAGVVQRPQGDDRDLGRAEEGEPRHRPRPASAQGSGAELAASRRRVPADPERAGARRIAHRLLALVLLEPLEQQDPVEVVELVLEDSSEQLVGLDGDLVSLEVEADEVDLASAGRSASAARGPTGSPPRTPTRRWTRRSPG